MRNYKAFLTSLWVVMASGGGIQAADNSAALLHPDRYKGLTEFKGKIQATDESSRRITLEDSSNQKVTVFVSSDTRVTDSGNRSFSWTSLRAGDPVVVYYEPKERVAIQIDRQATTAEGFLGIDHPVTK